MAHNPENQCKNATNEQTKIQTIINGMSVCVVYAEQTAFQLENNNNNRNNISNNDSVRGKYKFCECFANIRSSNCAFFAEMKSEEILDRER